MKVFCMITTILILFLMTPSVWAESETRSDLKEQLDKINDEYRDKITDLESRIEAIERARERQEQESELQQLLDDVGKLSQETAKPSADINRVFKGDTRQQPQLNPEISVTGDFFGSCTTSDDPGITDPGDFSDGMNQFYLRDLGLHFVAPLDPFTRGKFFLGIPGSGDVSLGEMIDEAYMEWLNLPGGMNLKIGQFYHQFGILNRYHDHGLPQFDRPRALNNLFGGNLGGFGLNANFLLPGLWATVNELDVALTTSGDGFCFDDAYDTVMGVAHLKNYYDLTRNTYLELGMSGAHGYNDRDHEYATTLAALDLTCKWVPAGRSHYRTMEFRSEFFFSHREEGAGNLDRYGFYTYIKNRMGVRKWVGVRYSYTELPWESDDRYEWDISPTLDIWQSEFVMWRLQYSYTERSFRENDHAVFLHAVWSMGPHKHEAY